MSRTDLLIYLIAGAIVGCLASRIMGTDSQQGILLDIVVGIPGTFLAVLLLAPLAGAGRINSGISLASMLVSLPGSIILLGRVGAVGRGA